MEKWTLEFPDHESIYRWIFFFFFFFFFSFLSFIPVRRSEIFFFFSLSLSFQSRNLNYAIQLRDSINSFFETKEKTMVEILQSYIIDCHVSLLTLIIVDYANTLSDISLT